MASPIQKILQEASFAYMSKAGVVVRLAISYIVEDHMDTEEAVDKSLQESQMDLFWESAVEAAIAKAFAKGAGIATIPLLPELREAWDPSGMKLSEKLHGTQKEMRQAIISTIQQQQKLGNHAMQAARALYDGYNSGIHVVRKQELPKYMQQVVHFVRRSEFPDDDYYALMRLVRRASRQTERLGTHGAPNRALRTAYKQLLQAVEENNTKAIENAIKTAVEEKSRYVAERIARTEAARAWADGFHYQYDGDAEVAAYRWKLSSRHPHFDICDMYAHANLWGLGSGIFPKDKTPILPVHPHCLCHLSPVYHSEIKNKQTNRIRAGGDEWLKSLSHMERYKVLGIQGAKKWEEHHADWRRYMRNWTAETAKSRLSITMSDDIIKEKLANILIDTGIKYEEIHYPPKPIGMTGILFDDGHINQEREHHVTKELAQKIINDALFSLTSWNGRSEKYYAVSGIVYTLDGRIRTAFLQDEFDGKVREMLEKWKKIKLSAPSLDE